MRRNPRPNETLNHVRGARRETAGRFAFQSGTRRGREPVAESGKGPGGGFAAEGVGEAEGLGGVADTSDGKGGGGTDDESAAGGGARGDVLERAVVDLRAGGESACDGRAPAQKKKGKDGQENPGGFLAVPLGLGEDDEIARKPHGFEAGKGNGIDDAPVETAVSGDGDGSGDEGHGGRGPEPVEGEIVGNGDFGAKGFARVGIGGDNPEAGRIGRKGGGVEGIETGGEGAVTEFRAEKVAGTEKGTDGAVAGIAAEADVVAEGTAGLVRFPVAAEGCAGGNADDAVETDAGLVEGIEDTGGEKGTHAAAFEHEAEAAGCMCGWSGVRHGDWMESP